MAAWDSLVGVVILAGGSSRRMGRDKLLLERDGVPLIEGVIADVHRQLVEHSSSAPAIVVGPQPPMRVLDHARVEALFTREEPPGGGPLPAIAAGLDRIDAPTVADSIVVVLAGDAPNGPAAMSQLIGSLDSDHDAAVLTDDPGRRQPLCAAYHLDALRRALTGIGELSGRRMDELLDQLTIALVPDTVNAAADIDTPDDARRLGFSQ